MTVICRKHPDFEGIDIGKIHDHIEKEHGRELTEDVFSYKDYKERYRKLFNETLQDIGLARPGDHAWVARSWGRPPKLGTEVADSEREKRR